MVVGRRPTRSPVPAHVLLLLSHLELAPIGWQLFGLGNFLNDQAAVSLAVDTFATRLLAQALSTNVKTKADRGRGRTGSKPASPPRRPRSRARGVRRASHGSAISL